MSRTALLTGVAGFIGSHLAEQLLADGWSVRGVDSFTPFYDLRVKEANLRGPAAREGFEFVHADLLEAGLEVLLDGVDTVFHLAAQPGIRTSWADFERYSMLNTGVTNRLLTAAGGREVRRFIYASSSSVYGNARTYPTDEEQLPTPYSPYGVTKLAGEHLCLAHAHNFGVPTIALRYFTVYGSRQRPDMAIHRMIRAALSGRPFPLYGTGEQVRDFTHVQDVVAATVAAAMEDVEPGTVLNVAGGSSTTVNEVISLVGELCGHDVPVERLPGQAGDVARTGGATDRARQALGWKPQIGVREGLGEQVAWQRGSS